MSDPTTEAHRLDIALHFANVPDPRHPAFREHHLLGDILVIALSAVLVGVRSWEGIAEFGRNAIQTAKQVLIQRVREAERDKVFKEYSDKVGSLVRGVVHGRGETPGNGMTQEEDDAHAPHPEMVRRSVKKLG